MRIERRGGALLLVVLLAIGLAGCRLFPVVVTDADAGSIHAVDVGDTVEVRLPGNASTGYEWIRTAPDPLDGHPLEIIEEGAYKVGTSGIHPVGEPGEFRFRYRAVDHGTMTLVFAYRRPWEPEPIEVLSFVVWVR